MSVYECHLWKYRKAVPLTQREFAKALGVSRQTVYLIESERMQPSLELAAKIAHLLQVPIETLFTFRDYHDDFFTENEEMRHRLEQQQKTEEFDAWVRSLIPPR